MDDLHDQEEPSPLLRLSGVHKHYGNGAAGVHALHGIDMQMAPGEMVAVCGPAGSGKTSLLNLIAMLEAPSEGSIIFAQLRLSKLSEQSRADVRADMMGLVFQAFTLIPVMTAQENVLLPLVLRSHLGPAQLQAAKERAEQLLAQLGMLALRDQYPPNLDPSQSQRVAVARALIAAPRLVLADEPTSRLDGACTRLVLDLFAREQQSNGTAFLIATREQRKLARVNRTLQLTDGRLGRVPAATPLRPLARVE